MKKEKNTATMMIIKQGKEKEEEREREREEGILAEEEQRIFGFCLCFGLWAVVGPSVFLSTFTLFNSPGGL